MTITALNDSVTYLRSRPDATKTDADVVVAVNADGTAIGAAVGTTGPAKAEDAAHVSGDLGIPAWGVRKDTAAAFGADGDYTPLRTDQYGDMASLIVDSTGAAVTYLASINGGTPVTLTGNSFLNIAAGQATTTVKSGAGVLVAIIFNGPATATSTMVVYDNTAASGTVIGRPLATAVVSPTAVQYGLAFSTGLTIITATANGADMTVVYR